MVSARACAMTFNRLVDAPFDRANPRTCNREIPSARIKLRWAWAFMVLCGLIFFLSAGMLNALALTLSPLALAIVLFYSYTKRFTLLTHFVLGLSLALAPLGGWIGVSASLELFPVLLGVTVLLWVAGFDIIYACQDVEVDRRLGLHSLPAVMGVKKALGLSALLHFLALVILLLPLWLCSERLGTGWLYALGCLAIGYLLLVEHVVVDPRRPASMNFAFFHVNALISTCLLVTSMGDLWLG